MPVNRKTPHKVKVNYKTSLSTQCTLQYNTTVMLERMAKKKVKSSGSTWTGNKRVEVLSETVLYWQKQYPLSWSQALGPVGQVRPKQADSLGDGGEEGGWVPQGRWGWLGGFTKKLKAPEEPGAEASTSGPVAGHCAMSTGHFWLEHLKKGKNNTDAIITSYQYKHCSLKSNNPTGNDNRYCNT